ncbi:MAG: protein translocase subunit SecD [Opitutaceae bacterium]|jgi:SecD/SecF fusion protein|nr:protein translocase subunit SecD [Opitutaceae bacterium]
MIKRNLWKLVLSFAIVAWAVATLYPLNDRPFAEYAKASSTAKSAEFAALIKEATDRTAAQSASGQAPSVFVALKQIARERKLDLAQFFPDINLGDVKNLEKRNSLLLDELLRLSKGKLQLGLDLKGGVAFTLEVDEAAAAATTSEGEREEKLAKAIDIIGNRINAFGVAEPIIRPVGKNRIEVQLPSISTKDNPEVVNAVKKPARLDFRLVHPFAMPGQVQDAPAGYEVMTLENELRDGQIYSQELFVKQIPEMTGEGVDTAYPTMDEYGRFKIILRFTAEGKKSFAAVTGAIAENNQRTGRVGQLAIVLDGKLYSAPTVREEINSDSAEISGSFTQREAFDLANVLNNPLDLPLQVKEQFEVTPTLADDAISSGRLAFIISTLLTIGFVVFFYTVGGFVAAVGMGINVLVTLGVMSEFGATLSLPGIAGIVLTLAMSVDSNILIFERMREELALGKSLPTSLEAGFEKAWSAIIDSNLTTLIVAAIMIALGNGPVKGFGMTLAIGIFTTMFAAVVVSKLLLEAIILPGTIKKLPMFSVLQNTKVDFLKYAKPAFIGSWVVVLIGVVVVAYKGREIYGIDFTGGDSVSLTFAQRIDSGVLRKTADEAGFRNSSFAYVTPIGTDVSTLKVNADFDKGKDLVAALQKALPQAKFEFAGESRIGPSVGEEIQWNALLSVFWALVLIGVYVAFRFEIGYGMGAVISTIHDLLMTIGLFVLFGRQFNASMVAAILLIAGYSINDTIVVFDRIREELRLNPTLSLANVINRALNLTLSRTIITGGTTLLTAITLLVVTSGEVNDIAFTLLIGVITGTFSSLFIASPIFYWWHKGDRKHVEKHQDVKPTYEWTGASKASE